MRFPLIALALIATVCSAQAASAPDAGPTGKHHGEMLQKFDTNHNSKLDDTERAALRDAIAARMKEKHPDLFAKIDTNHDGQLSMEEMKAFRAEHGKRGGAQGEHADHGAHAGKSSKSAAAGVN